MADAESEQVYAWVRVKQEISGDEISAWCKGKISHPKVPAHIRVVDAFPMTVTGKIQKFAMRDIERAMQDAG
jgi:fatty-acyl-CoA synthase